jgi:hypothetical protein
MVEGQAPAPDSVEANLGPRRAAHDLQPADVLGDPCGSIVQCAAVPGDPGVVLGSQTFPQVTKRSHPSSQRLLRQAHLCNGSRRAPHTVSSLEQFQSPSILSMSTEIDPTPDQFFLFALGGSAAVEGY